MITVTDYKINNPFKWYHKENLILTAPAFNRNKQNAKDGGVDVSQTKPIEKKILGTLLLR